MGRVLSLLAAALLLISGCGDDDSEPASAPDPTDAARTITVSSPAFDDGEPIPTMYTCQGKGSAPDLEWSGVPDDVLDLALVVDDPDAPGGGYVHWAVLGLPAHTGGIEAGHLPEQARELEGSGELGWDPPCPPSGEHHYRFTVYALDPGSAFAFSKDTPLDTILSTVADDAVAWGRLTGTVTAPGGGSGGGY